MSSNPAAPPNLYGGVARIALPMVAHGPAEMAYSGIREIANEAIRRPGTMPERGVSVAPGSAFGQEAAGAVRISLASSDPDLREGVGRLAEFVHRST